MSSCCGQIESSPSQPKMMDRRLHGVENLPIKVFCCMAKTTHTLIITMFETLGAGTLPTWDSLREDEREARATMAKQCASGENLEGGTYNKLFSRVVGVLVHGE